MNDTPQPPSPSAFVPAPSPQAPQPNPARFVPFLVLGIGLLVAALTFGSFFLSSQEEKQLLATGAPAQAEIVHLEDTGNRFNNNPEIALTLVVRPEGGEPFQVVVTKVLDAIEIQQYQIGVLVDVRYDPADLESAAIVGILAKPATPAPASAPPSAP